ncbi:hypothetical protein M2197_006384 [Bradyrhizobium japonicum]|nr:hypothetical protein CF64_12375 [Bradyrhizobium japonicum]MCS3539932.1 hypothetical protein [Bradyrhizobium japonicum]MCS3992865.1 hypothetical protein [Bradyrhizobium japonicum]MCS4021203.1 hypothetical protein [Bradyrhizobium japonicum]MCS4208312.1 hypothetical protein [Bradyrhizobium japonicum]
MALRSIICGSCENSNSLVQYFPTSAAATAPTAADSVALARPLRMVPTMTIGISRVGDVRRIVMTRWRGV